MSMHEYATRSSAHALLLPGLPNTTKQTKESPFRHVFRNARGRLLRGKRLAEEGDTHHRQQQTSAATVPAAPAKVRRVSETPTAAATDGVPAHPSTHRSGKRKRGDMGYTDIAIHEDCSAETQHLQTAENQYQVMTDHDQIMQCSDDDSESEDEEVDDTVAEDMRKLEESFKGISRKYRLINKIGEGTFSTVYKAEQLDLPFDGDTENEDPTADSAMPPLKRRRFADGRQSRLVALKKIYVTSSPQRILNELELLHELRNCPHICPLLTAFRHHDQVVAVLPYSRHLDFRLYYREFLTNDLRHYFISLFTGLAYVHKAGIIHRDIKPTNFLYDHQLKQGVLVDFGLAERQGTDWQPCFCQQNKDVRRERFLNSFAVQNLQNNPDLHTGGYPKHDNRPSRRANRAGTRGFRAPEVLLKCTAQTTKIDIWSVGVILLTLLGRRFPFFNSADDIDAIIEIASIFGKKKMQGVAAMHGSVFETNIETIGEKGFPLDKIVLWAACREKPEDQLHAGEVQAVNLLQGLLELDPHKRLSAKQALDHEFFTAPIEDEFERDEREQQEAEEKQVEMEMQEKVRRRRERALAQMV